jgi:curved DNA-binding protein CbpA
MELAVPVTPRQIRRRYSELALRWHPDRNRSAQAHEQMTALNRAIELLSGIEARILSGKNGTSSSGDGSMAVNYHDGQFTMPSEFDEGLTDWIYAAEFAAHSNRVYLGGYSGRVAMLDADGEARQVYNVGLPPRRIIDTGGFLYILTDPALYVLRDGSFQRIIDLLDGGELVMAQTGFGLLETKRLRGLIRRASCSPPFSPPTPFGASISLATGW